MMRAGNVLAVAMLLCCIAGTHMQEDVSDGDHSYAVDGPEMQNLDPQGAENLVRNSRYARYYGFLPPYSGLQYNYIRPPYSGSQHQISPSRKYNHGAYPKMDRSELNGFAGIRTLEGGIDSPPGNVNEVPTTPPPREVNMDEIDLSRFPIGHSRKSGVPYENELSLSPKLSGFAVVYVLE